MRAVTVGSAKVVEVADTCWPTMGARPVSKAIRNASTWRRFVSGLLPKLKTLACRKSNTVSTLPSWRKPKPRTWSPTKPVAGACAPGGTPNMPTFW